MPVYDKIGTKLLGVATRLVRTTSRLTLADKKPAQENRDSAPDAHPQHPLLNHLLQSNLPPQEHELEVIHECIARDTAERDRLTASLQGNSDHRHETELERQLHSLNLAIDAWNSLLSPVRRLPADILLEIFGYLLVPISTISDLPWSLSHICRYWRDVVLCTPAMWRQFPTIVPVTSEFAESQQVELVQLLTERASHGFELRILGSTVNQLSRPVLLLLTGLSKKWKKFTITATLDTMESISVAEDHLDTLEELAIDFLYIDSEEAGPTHNVTVTTFHNAPILQRVTLTGEFHARIALPPYLTSFHDKSWGIHAKERLLTIGRYDRLQDLCIVDAEIQPLSPADPEGSGSIHLPQLTSLCLKCCVNAETGLLRFGFFPKLHRIRIDARTEGTGDVYRALATLLSRSKCGLVEVLKLDLHTSARNSPLSRVLQLTPHLKELWCSLPTDSDIHQMAVPNRGQDILVPNLTECTFVLWKLLNLRLRETMSAVQLFLATRCQSPGMVSSQMAFKIREYDNDSGYPTDKLTLAQSHLETWYKNPSRHPLFFFKFALAEYLPQIKEVHPHDVPLSHQTVKKTIMTLARIEGYEPTDINEVMSSGVHVTIARLRNLSCDDSVEENRFKPFREQVLRIQEKWENLLSDTSDKHWIWTSPALDEIQYIPDYSSFREDIDRFNKSIMAMPDDHI